MGGGRLKQTLENSKNRKGGGGLLNLHKSGNELNLDLHKSGNELSLDLHKSGNELSLDLHKSGNELSLDLHINESPKWNPSLLDFFCVSPRAKRHRTFNENSYTELHVTISNYNCTAIFLTIISNKWSWVKKDFKEIDSQLRVLVSALLFVILCFSTDVLHLRFVLTEICEHGIQ